MLGSGIEPLLVGVNDTKLLAWMSDWNEEKYSLINKNLESTSLNLSPSQVRLYPLRLSKISNDFTHFSEQVQIFASHLRYGLPPQPYKSLKKSLFKNLDVSQLQGIEWNNIKFEDAFKPHLLTVCYCQIVFPAR